ncbi:Hypothetical protein SCLAV_3073 [Streptomyces clavuligerus]|uniref:Uncharacterized protein n=1 Tax=Streptomyces clavuligerus TaxID=1901 RepID=E2PXQ4_STRCL|nr:Hypothetical protein SCLAV_3073 [Streptomyces clavuligerus]
MTVQQSIGGYGSGGEILQSAAGEHFQHSLHFEQSTLRTVDPIELNPFPKLTHEGGGSCEPGHDLGHGVTAVRKSTLHGIPLQRDGEVFQRSHCHNVRRVEGRHHRRLLPRYLQRLEKCLIGPTHRDRHSLGCPPSHALVCDK